MFSLEATGTQAASSTFWDKPRAGSWLMLDDVRIGAMSRASPAAARATPLRLLHVIPSFTTGGVPIRLVNIANRLGQDFRHLVLALDGVTSAAARLLPSVD